jgi:hypothetical protein
VYYEPVAIFYRTSLALGKKKVQVLAASGWKSVIMASNSSASTSSAAVAANGSVVTPVAADVAMEISAPQSENGYVTPVPVAASAAVAAAGGKEHPSSAELRSLMSILVARLAGMRASKDAKVLAAIPEMMKEFREMEVLLQESASDAAMSVQERESHAKLLLTVRAALDDGPDSTSVNDGARDSKCTVPRLEQGRGDATVPHANPEMTSVGAVAAAAGHGEDNNSNRRPQAKEDDKADGRKAEGGNLDSESRYAKARALMRRARVVTVKSTFSVALGYANVEFSPQRYGVRMEITNQDGDKLDKQTLNEIIQLHIDACLLYPVVWMEYADMQVVSQKAHGGVHLSFNPHHIYPTDDAQELYDAMSVVHPQEVDSIASFVGRRFGFQLAMGDMASRYALFFNGDDESD